MQIRIRHLYRADPETVQKAAYAFAAHVKRIGVEHSNVLRLRPHRCPTNGEHTRKPSLLAQKVRGTGRGQLFYNLHRLAWDLICICCSVHRLRTNQ